MIQMISITELYPHKDNPRKDLGDLSELTESIKVNGIFQNLTVTPRPEGGYTVIIGHRRMEAAKLAGLTELPCAVVDMDERTQLSTMLLENMQRSDLTTYEQAQGFQLMFDLGMSEKEIADKSGFTVATVKKRLKIATLPADDLKEAMGRGGTLEQYVAISEITDPKARTSLLKNVGTNNFEWALSRAKRKQEIDSVLPGILEELAYAEREEGMRWNSTREEVKSVNILKWKKGDLVCPEPTEKYTFEISGDWVYLGKIVKKKKPQKDPQVVEADRRRDELRKLTKEAFECRKNFVENFEIKKEQHDMMLLKLVELTVADANSYYHMDCSLLKNVKPSFAAALKAIQYLAGDSDCEGYAIYRWGVQMPAYNPNPELNSWYDFLAELGYQISDEEIALRDGTHELFGSVGLEK